MPTRPLFPAFAASLLLACGAAAQQGAAPGAPAPAPQAKPTPTITADPATLDLGKMPDDKSVHGQITVKNDGNADLVISGISSTCGCTIPTLAGQKMDTDKKQSDTTSVTLKPGETTVVDVEFHPSGKHDKQDQKVTIKSNDPARRELVVDVLAFVQPIVSTDPQVLNFGEVERGQAKTMIATVTGQTADFALPLVTTGTDAITARILDTTDGDEGGIKVRRVRVEFTLNSPKAMTIAGAAMIRTNDPRRRFASLPMTGVVLGDIALDPVKVSLGLAAPGSIVEKSIRLHSRSGKPFKVLGLTERGLGTSPAEWEIADAGSDAPGASDLKLTFTAPNKSGSWKGTLVIATDVPDQEKIEVPYNGSVRPAAPQPAPAEPASPGGGH